jgi:effector-binding domain-containing protein
MEIIEKELRLDLFGFSGVAINKNYSGAAFKLMDKMWQAVKSNKLKNKGRNIWVYEPNEMVFAGVELDDLPSPDIGLEQKNITLRKYCYYKHIGPYHLIQQAGQSMDEEIRKRGLVKISPYVEIYGHWNNDESKLVTELFMCLR